MDFTGLQESGRAHVSPDTWAYFRGAADGDVGRDSRAWAGLDLVPRVLTQLTRIDTSIRLGADTLASPIVLAPVASQRAAHPDGELATRRAASSAGMLAGYSFHASVDVETFARAAAGPWWAQAYVMTDRSISDAYLERCAAAGAGAIVLTVDVAGELADAPFRRLTMTPEVADRGNHPRDDEGRISPVLTESALGPDEIARTADVSGLPVWVKGVMTAADASLALDAGAAGVFVSNHGRRQLAGVAPTAAVLREVVEGVGDRAPVLVDGGIRSGTDVVRALALGASAVAIGRPIVWALAAGGQATLEEVLTLLNDEVRVALAGLGVGRVADLDPSMVRRATL